MLKDHVAYIAEVVVTNDIFPLSLFDSQQYSKLSRSADRKKEKCG
jgi:hypothetical protein